jgi:hypothetical protein
VQRDTEGHPASPETRGLHGQQRRGQLAHLHLRNEELEGLHVVLLVARESADVGIGLRDHEPDAVGGGRAADGDVAGVRSVRWTSLPASGAKVARVAAREDRRDWTAVSKGGSWSPEKSKRCCRCGTISHWASMALSLIMASGVSAAFPGTAT